MFASFSGLDCMCRTFFGFIQSKDAHNHKLAKCRPYEDAEGTVMSKSIKMTHASLFSGIGGFDLAAEWMGWENVFNCEIESFPRRILNYYFPKAISYEDITKTDFTVHRGRINVLTGGFPCQPYSTAGKRLGKADSRHLFPEMLRAIKEIQPRWVIGENVRGLVSWNGGLVFDEVCADLEGEGYEVIPFLIPAAGINAPHRRDRIWFVAHARTGRDSRNPGEVSREAAQKNGRGTQSGTASGEQIQLPNESDSLFRNASNTESSKSRQQTKRERWENITGRGKDYIGNQEKRGVYASDTSNTRLQGSKNERVSGDIREKSHEQSTRCILPNWEKFPTQSPLCNGDDGLSNRLDSITFSKWRKESIKGGGNAVVPQIPYIIFKTIQKYEEEHTI